MVYPDNVNTREEKILYVMAAYGISEEDSGLLRQHQSLLNNPLNTNQPMMNQRLVNIIEAFLLQNVGSKDLQEDARRTLESHASSPTREVTEEVREEVRAFSEIMEQKLKENDHKHHWSNYPPEELIVQLKEEIDELESQLWKTTSSDTEAKEQEIKLQRECADIANFAMMIADNVKKLSLSNTREVEGGWVKCSDRLPTEDETYTVGNPEYETGECFFEDGKWRPHNLNPYNKGNITHWQIQTLPKPPSVNSKEL